ncbi:Metallothionein expression activator, partial [Dinochytrium kinnereticum]
MLETTTSPVGPSTIAPRPSSSSDAPDALMSGDGGTHAAEDMHPNAVSKMYHCPHDGCDKTFTRRYNLQSHLRCHSGERPFTCRFCTATFSRKHDLRRHTRSLHSEDRPHHCRHCNLSFARSDALKRHLSSEAKR